MSIKRKQRAILLLAAGTFAAAAPSLDAADLGGYPPYRRPLDGSYRSSPPQRHPGIWSGLYLGAHLGGGWGEVSSTAPATGSLDTDGWLGGLHAGYNAQFDRFIAGFEVDGTWTNVEGKVSVPPAALESGHDWLSSARLRLGYAVNDWMMIYATGGLAIGEGHVFLTDGVNAATASETMLGYVIGGGVDLKLTGNVSGRIEALHYGFGSESFSFPGGTIKGDADLTTVRAGLSFHFN